MTSRRESGSATAEPASGAGKQGGFTLIELVVALAVMGLALVLIVGYKAPWSSGLGLEGTASELASGLRLARSQAIADNQPVAFSLDLAGHRYRVGGEAQRHHWQYSFQPRRQLHRRQDHAC